VSQLPSYVSAAQPVPAANRAAWFKTIAPTYAGVMLWFVFWQSIVQGEGTPGGVLSAGLGPALLSLVIAALICHFLFYLAPAALGMKTGLPLYIIGTSTYGILGGLFMPGLLMGLLQFGWLAVNADQVATILCECFKVGLLPDESGATIVNASGMAHGLMAAAFAVVAALVGLKGIKYVAGVATFLPLIPVVVLAILLVKTCGGLGGFAPAKLVAADAGAAGGAASAGLSAWMVLSVVCIYVVGFFATAGAAGVDIASNSRNDWDVHWGGLGGVVLPTILAGGAAMLIVAGAYGGGGSVVASAESSLNPVQLMPKIWNPQAANIAKIGLAIASFPGACFAALIAANSFKTTMPKVNPWISVGLGTLVAVLLAVSGVVTKVIWVFVVIGASFGPVCGAMLADYLLSGGKWSGPRAGFNPAGWISWIVGFAAGAFNLVVNMLLPCEWAVKAMPNLADWQNFVPVPPVTAMLVGFVLYYVLGLVGVRTKVLDMESPDYSA